VHIYVRPETNGRKQLKTAILLMPSPQILDVLENFYGRKNVRLGVNGNPEYEYDGYSEQIYWMEIMVPCMRYE